MLSSDQIKEALLIRRIEESFLDLFSQGKLNGTVHTSVGQEFSAIAFAGHLDKNDFIFSNHRCHGHYISYTKDYYGLLAELLGKKVGVCGGVGSSQHLQHGNFYSNGIQGGIVPLAAGMALSNKLSKNDNIGIVFIGDGTLGEGVLYETLNLISLWELPIIVVCENNRYAQSTSIDNNLAGTILKRAEAFSIKTYESDTWNVDQLLESAVESITFVRKKKLPLFHLVNTYRLNAHSKGDDDRDGQEIDSYRQKDFLSRFANDKPALYKEYLEPINLKISKAIEEILAKEELLIEEYHQEESLEMDDHMWSPITEIRERQVNLINKFFLNELGSNPKTIFLGEDVLSPYGGAFKVAKGLSEKYPHQVFTTPISEAAITGIANGLALSGYRPFVEIMFGDFITLALDQIINHASKVRHMYNHKVMCPLVIRTPMGGRRGYGPTHSQTLDRFLIGIDNVKTIALNTLINPEIIYTQVGKETDPVIVIENKVDYGKYIGSTKLDNYDFLMNDESYPVVKITPISSKPDLTIVTYGGMVSEVIDSITTLFIDYDIKTEVIALSKINPINYDVILKSVAKTKRLVVVEEGSRIGGIGSEIISSVIEMIDFHIEVLKIGALPVPIPSVRSLEDSVLPVKNSIISAINQRFK
ncbi:MAG: thiamine pyrophosphate-dependent enzyme [Cyclobacteriaceae bacterium]